MKKIIKKVEKYYKSKEVSLFFYPLACLLYESGAKEEAFDLLVEGVAKFPRYLLALIKIAQILIDEEKYEAAESYLETVLNINNSNVLAWELLALSYEKQNKIEQAINAYEKLLVLDPSPKVKSKLLSLASSYTPNVEKVKEDLAQNSSIQKPLNSKETDTSDIVILDVEKPVETKKQEETAQNLEQNKP
ncbi:MAG TPA: tetratricopeptide repeat protein, partial [Desulfurella acetivorans]|nr:tetratricopeptide repeat protein [Desulfurella acetivorans]